MFTGIDTVECGQWCMESTSKKTQSSKEHQKEALTPSFCFHRLVPLETRKPGTMEQVAQALRLLTPPSLGIRREAHPPSQGLAPLAAVYPRVPSTPSHMSPGFSSAQTSLPTVVAEQAQWQGRCATTFRHIAKYFQLPKGPCSI